MFIYTSSIPADHLANYWETSGVTEMEEPQWCYMSRPSRSTQRKTGGDTGKTITVNHVKPTQSQYLKK